VAVDTLPATWRPEVVYDRSSPPLSGRSTPSPRPSLQSHDYIHKYHTLNSTVSSSLQSHDYIHKYHTLNSTVSSSLQSHDYIHKYHTLNSTVSSSCTFAPLPFLFELPLSRLNWVGQFPLGLYTELVVADNHRK